MKTSQSKKTNYSRGFSVALTSTFLVVFFSLGILRVAAAVTTEYIYSDTAVPQVLGDSEEEKMAEVEKKQVEERRESQKKMEEQQREAAKKRNEEQRVRVQPKETEIETADGLKVKTKVEHDGRTKLEIEQKRFKLKAETRNLQRERTEVEAETENDDKLRIASDSGRPSLIRRNIKSNSDFPLSVDPSTNALTVTTPQGIKTVTVLPDQAVANLLRVGLISTDSANLSAPVSSINLTEKDGKAVYQVQGKKKFKFLGMLNVEAPVSVTVSAEDGQIISQERSLLTDIVDFFSP